MQCWGGQGALQLKGGGAVLGVDTAEGRWCSVGVDRERCSSREVVQCWGWTQLKGGGAVLEVAPAVASK